MTVRDYTPEERAAMSGGLPRDEWEALTRWFESMVKATFRGMPLATQAAALHGLLCGNDELVDALETLEATCEEINGVTRECCICGVSVAAMHRKTACAQCVAELGV